MKTENINKMGTLSRVTIGVGSLALIAVAFVPVWFIYLIAPQYPEGLTMNIWLNKITGQVDIINGLNHYIGMRHIDEKMFPEFHYLIYVLGFFVVFGLLIAVTGKRKLLFYYLVLTVIAGLTALGDFYKWGYDYGHNLDPKAPIQIPGLYYQPPVLGHKTLLNFDAYSYPDTGGWIVVAVASVFFFVWFMEWRKSRKQKTIITHTVKKAVPIAATIFLFAITSCNTKPEPFKYGKDICDDCNMSIMDGKFGGEVITKKGKLYKFDDIHCLVHFIKSGNINEADIKQTYFINYKGSDFIDANSAVLITSPELKSPMNGNTAAFVNQQEAEKKANEVHGKIVSWKTLLNTTTVFSKNCIFVGKDQPIASLRTAIEKAKDGDTIVLTKGIYKEGNIVVNKSVSLIGIDEPILDGENKNEILTISGNYITIKGLHFQNSGYSSMNDYASISVVDARDVTVENNDIKNAYFAIHFANAHHCTIRNNTISGTPKTEQTSGNGIHLWKCDSMLVQNNNVQGHRDGIYFEFVANSTIAQNNSHDNIRYGLHFMFSNNDTYKENIFKENGAGVAVMFSNHVVMHGNFFDHNWGANAYGILLKEISDATVEANHFDKNTMGIQMEGTNRIEIVKNSFENNGWALRIQASCNDNTIHHNNFDGNTFDVATNGTLMLNKFYNNYWDKYEGYDMNKDGIGDVPYHPVSMYSMMIEQNPNSIILLRSFMETLLDKAEKAIPSLTPEKFIDEQPLMKKFI